MIIGSFILFTLFILQYLKRNLTFIAINSTDCFSDQVRHNNLHTKWKVYTFNLNIKAPHYCGFCLDLSAKRKVV